VRRLSRDVPRTAWWLDPAKLIGFFLIPLYVVVYFTPQLLGRGAVDLDYRIYLSGYYFALGLGFLSAVLLGVLGGKQLYPRADDPTLQLPIKSWFLELLALGALIAYLIWFRNLLLRPWVIVQMILEGSIGTSRLEHRTIGGLTTLTQLGVAYVILFLDRVWRTKGEPLPRRFYWYFWAVVALATLRVYVWAERLALIELVVPMVVLYCMHRGLPRRRSLRTIVQLAPLLGIIALLTYFAATEYFRSWNTFYQYQRDPFGAFVTKRVLTYYYTALNNGAGMLAVLEWPDYRFEHTLQWLYRFPLMIGPIFRFTLAPNFQPSGFLARYADPEFNNMSGIYTVFYDVGIAGAVLYAVLWGGLCGYVYNSCKMGAGVGRALFPLVFITLIETIRILYLDEPRAYPALVALVVGYFLMRDRRASGQRDQVRLKGRQHRVLDAAPRWFSRRLPTSRRA
jgi:hypothetical protein